MLKKRDSQVFSGSHLRVCLSLPPQFFLCNPTLPLPRDEHEGRSMTLWLPCWFQHGLNSITGMSTCVE